MNLDISGEQIGAFIRTTLQMPKKEAVNKVNSPPRTPWEVLRGINPGDKKLAESIRNSFDERFLFITGENHFVPLRDLGDGNIYVCSPITEKNGQGNPSIYLDPKRWNDALTEFLRLAKELGDESLRLCVLSHEFDSKYEWIMIKPVIVNSMGTYRTSRSRYGLSPDGRVSFGNEKEGFPDLGFLDPERVVKEMKERLLHSLKEHKVL